MKILLFAAGVAIALTQAATAQTATPMSPATTPMTRSATEAGTFVTVPSTDMLSSNVVGLDVYNADKKDIGTIKDIAMSTDGVHAYIVGVGGFLGMGDHYVAVNPADLHISYNESSKKWQAKMDATAAQLKAAPEFKYTGAFGSGKS